jgi:DDE superfamily endonuclease
MQLFETNVYYSPEDKHTLSRRGVRTVIVSKTGSSSRCTVMLGVAGDGHRFPPYVIFCGEPDGRIDRRELANVNPRHEQGSLANHPDNNYALSNFYAVQPKAWMDGKLMLDWVEKVLRPWCNARVGPTIVILDEFSAHLTTATRRAIADLEFHLETVQVATPGNSK